MPVDQLAKQPWKPLLCRMRALYSNNSRLWSSCRALPHWLSKCHPDGYSMYLMGLPMSPPIGLEVQTRLGPHSMAVTITGSSTCFCLATVEVVIQQGDPGAQPMQSLLLCSGTHPSPVPGASCFRQPFNQLICLTHMHVVLWKEQPVSPCPWDSSQSTAVMLA